jgi:D-galactonate transporter
MKSVPDEASVMRVHDFEADTYGKYTWRIFPLLLLCYALSYLDKVNIGYAKLQMLGDLKFSETIYGVGAGVFFLGYFLFEVPSNLILYRVGARKWIARIMITWGIISSAMLWVKSPTTFYIMRFLLGIAEAGFFPGIILYLTQWFPASRRGRMIALFMTGIPLSGVVGGPISGWVLQSLSGVYGLAGWQWLFLLEGIPSVVVGFAVWLWLDDTIEGAKWLDPDQKRLLLGNLSTDVVSRGHSGLGEIFRDPHIWLFCTIYFCIVMGVFGISFWLPTLIKASGIKDSFHIGLLAAIPNAVAAVGMVLAGRSADRRNERRLHLAAPCFLGCVGLFFSVVFSHSAVVAIISLCIATLGILTALPMFWSFPTGYLSGVGAAGGIALINSVGNVAGFVSPYMVGLIKDLTHSTDLGMYVLAACLLFGSVLVVSRLPVRPSGDARS